MASKKSMSKTVTSQREPATTQAAADVPVETSTTAAKVEVPAPSTDISEITSAHASDESHRAAPRTPRLQSRRAGIFMFEEVLPDGRVRIIQILDSPVAFSAHPEFVAAMNQLRRRNFSEESARLYMTKDTEIPLENPDRSVVFAYIHTRTGNISGEKVFTKQEARTFLAKMRAEIKAWREKNHHPSKPADSPTEFGTELGEAMRAAQQHDVDKIASN